MLIGIALFNFLYFEVFMYWDVKTIQLSGPLSFDVEFDLR